MFDSENFSFKGFIDHIMQKMHLEGTEEPLKSKIEKEIARILGDRILTCTMNAMTAENLAMYDMVRMANPEMTELEALLSMIDKIPLLHEVMIKGVNDLAEELVYDVDRLDVVLQEKSNKQKVKK